MGSGPPASSALSVWEEHWSEVACQLLSAQISGICALVLPIVVVCPTGRWLVCVHLTYSVCFYAGADEPHLSGDPEAGSDGRGVVPQTEAGQHGRDKRQLTTTGCCQ